MNNKDKDNWVSKNEIFLDFKITNLIIYKWMNECMNKWKKKLNEIKTKYKKI